MLEHEQRVQITVAAVRYNCLGRDRTGVASVQLSDRLKVCASHCEIWNYDPSTCRALAKVLQNLILHGCMHAHAPAFAILKSQHIHPGFLGGAN